MPYLVLALPVLPDLLLTLGTQMPTPAVVVELFEDPDMVVLAWIHILALDTLAGRHIWRRMLVSGQPRAVSFPVLLFCLLLGPLGFAAGMALTWNAKAQTLRSLQARRTLAHEPVSVSIDTTLTNSMESHSTWRAALHPIPSVMLRCATT